MPLDIALVWDNATGTADFAMNGPDLETDTSLRTRVILSLFVDREATPGDFIPDGTNDRRGWWGDVPIEAVPSGDSKPDRIGSRLWLLDRSRQIPDTLRRAEAYAREALQWMLDDQVAGALDVAASFPRRGWLQLDIAITQAGAAEKYALAWNALLAA